MDHATLETRIRELVATVVRENTGHRISPGAEDPLISAGYLDSMSLVGLVIALQREFDLELEVDDMSAENFETVRAICTLVASRT